VKENAAAGVALQLQLSFAITMTRQISDARQRGLSGTAPITCCIADIICTERVATRRLTLNFQIGNRMLIPSGWAHLCNVSIRAGRNLLDFQTCGCERNRPWRYGTE
jgi:hypothetical protein